MAACVVAPACVFAQAQQDEPMQEPMQVQMPMPIQAHSSHAMPPTATGDEAADDVVAHDQEAMALDAAVPSVSNQAPSAAPVSGHSTMDDSTMDQAGMDHARTDHSAMDHSAMEQGMADNADPPHARPVDPKQAASDGGATPGMTGMGAMQGGKAPADARDPDYSDGLAEHAMTPAQMAEMDMHDDGVLGSILVDRLEAFETTHARGQSVDAQAWLGSDLDKAWVKIDGERSNGRLERLRSEALWNRAIAPYWALQAGLRHDSGPGPGRDWAALGVQGLAPYWFDIEATAYVGPSGRTALRVEAEYELMLTQRLVLQPDIEVTAYGRDDRARGIGAGLSDVEAGLRLRYEMSRKFAPYVGIAWSRAFGRTAAFARDADEERDETHLVTGIRFRF